MTQPSTEPKIYDYIIAGAGAAGLSLMWHILQDEQLLDKSILIIDQDFKITNDKTWCFWNKDGVPFPELISHSWTDIEIRSRQHIFSQVKSRFGYHCISSEVFRKELLELARQTSNIDLIAASVVGFDVAENVAVVQTDQGDFNARFTFQSLIKQTLSAPLKNPLKQHFRGHIIRSKKSLFKSNCATLMDFNIPDEHKNKTAFFYVLPYNEFEALIEYTFFYDGLLPQSEFDEAISWYMKDRYKISSDLYEITHTEEGIIPMDDTPLHPKLNSRTWNIGTVGGSTKPTTGYTFLRIQEHCKAITTALRDDKFPEPFENSKFRFRFYDHLLLHILKNQESVGPDIFHQLFENNNIDDVLLFLEESTELRDELKIFATLPWAPFFKALAQTKLGLETP